MKKQIQSTTDELLQQGKNEFLEKGFEKASLRDISSKSGVSTHAIYTRFGDKVGFFSALVCDSGNELKNIHKDFFLQLDKSPITTEKKFYEINKVFDAMLEYIYLHLNDFRLICCMAKGTEYENYFCEFAIKDMKFYKKIIKQFKKRNLKVDELFIKTVCENNYAALASTVINNLSYKGAKNFVHKINEFTLAGWKKILE